MEIVGIIPARYASARFPGKVLAEIAGRTMLERVWRATCRCRSLSRVIVATDDERVVDTCRAMGADVAMTSPRHATGTDRAAEVAAGLDADCIVDIQGDEPLIEPFVIEAAIEALRADRDAPMATVVHAAEASALDDPNRVKVVLDQKSRALYFSRAPIPGGGRAKAFWQHVGLYAYRRDFLLEFVGLPQGELELAESLEQLRALEHGHAIAVGVIEGWRSVPVDVPADIARVEAALRGDAEAR